MAKPNASGPTPSSTDFQNCPRSAAGSSPPPADACSNRFQQTAYLRVLAIALPAARGHPIDHVAAHVGASRPHRCDEARFNELHFHVVPTLPPILLDPLLQTARAFWSAEI